MTHDPPGRPDPERRRRAAVHLVLPPARLHRGARRGLPRPRHRRRRRTRSRRSSPTRGCARKATGRSARTRASSSRSCKVGHGRALGRRDDVARPTWSTKACAARTTDPDNRCARRSSPTRRARARTRSDNTPAVVHFELVPGDTVDVQIAAKGGGSREQVEVHDAESVRLDRRLGAEDGADDGRRLVPAGHAGHRHRRQRGEGDAARQGSADGAASTCTSFASAGRRTASRSCASSSMTRSTRSASARRASAGCRRCST